LFLLVIVEMPNLRFRAANAADAKADAAARSNR